MIRLFGSAVKSFVLLRIPAPLEPLRERYNPVLERDGSIKPGLEEYVSKMRSQMRSHPAAFFGDLTGGKDSRLSRITVSVAMGQLLGQLL
ncbi:MAG: hypothetical protein F6K56_11185 [Moorea sp. SIO3G5]|nr:hypothetical protein [Moorena sp. SIO3G5]